MASGHQRIALIHGFVDEYFFLPQLFIEFFHLHIVNGISEHACLRRSCREQTRIGMVCHRIDCDILTVHQLCQHLCGIEQHFTRLVLVQAGRDLIQLSEAVVLVDDLI